MQGIRRQVAILDAVSAAPESGISITELCAVTGLSKGTAHRLLEGLREQGIVVQEDSKRWRLGPRVAFWAGRYLEGPASLGSLRELTRRLSRETQFFTYLAILDGGEIVSVAVERPESKAHFFVQLGSRVPVLSTAAARALLAYRPQEAVRPLVERAVEENPRTRTETFTVESYLEGLVETRRRGYAECMEELEAGVSALSAPVLNAQGVSAASLSVVAPTAALLEEWDEIVGMLRRIAEEGSMMLGREKVAGW